MGLPQASTPCTPRPESPAALTLPGPGSRPASSAGCCTEDPSLFPIRKGRRQRTSMEDTTAEGRSVMVLEGQGRYFFSYSHHHVSMIEGRTCLSPLLRSPLQAHAAPPLNESFSCALYLGIRAAHPSFTPTTSRGLAEMRSLQLNPLCWLPDPAPPQSQPYGPCIS